MAKSNEPIFWSLFAAGGMLAAMFLPILMTITGILVPLGLAPQEALSFERVYPAVSNNLALKLILFGLIALPFFHAAHRFRYILVDMGLRRIRRLVGFLCYGSAIAATITAAILLWQI